MIAMIHAATDIMAAMTGMIGVVIAEIYGGEPKRTSNALPFRRARDGIFIFSRPRK